MTSAHWLQSWPSAIPPAEKIWLEDFSTNGANTYIANVSTEFRLLRYRNHVLPVTVNQHEYQSSYVCSPYNAFVDYARDEVRLVAGKPLSLLIHPLISALGLTLRAGRINQNVHVNNWLLSTNLYPVLEPEAIGEITQFLLRQFPNHALIFRSLNQVHHAQLLHQFRSEGYGFMPSRQIYLLDGANPIYLKKRDTRQDLKLLETKDYSFVDHGALNAGDFKRIVELYNLLYLAKYSIHNPQFTEAFIETCHRHQLLTMTGLRDSSGQLQGILGSFERNRVLTVPLLGYNTQLPQSHGLYRLLSAHTLREVTRRGLSLNFSAGAASFKRLRGAEPTIEWAAIYSRHLPRHRRAVIAALCAILNALVIPLVKKYKL